MNFVRKTIAAARESCLLMGDPVSTRTPGLVPTFEPRAIVRYAFSGIQNSFLQPIMAGRKVLEGVERMIRYSTERLHIDWEEAATVIQRAPLGLRRRDAEQLRRAFDSSYAVVYVFDSTKLIGMGRALCDGEYQAAIYDVVLLPEYQGKGIGRHIMKRLCDQLPPYNILLYAVPGKEGFYEKCGFRKMCTAMAILNPQVSDPEYGLLE